MTKIYVTRYALSIGIYAVEARLREDGKSATCFDRFGNYDSSYHGNDFRLTAEEAIADAEARRAKKLASIEKQAAKLRKMTFAVKEPGHG